MRTNSFSDLGDSVSFNSALKSDDRGFPSKG